MSAAMRGRIAAALALPLLAASAAAGDAPVGPCSPFHAADGDVPSEMPGCAGRRRPAAGSLGDEVEFARGRRAGAQAGPDDPDEDAPPRHRRR